MKPNPSNFCGGNFQDWLEVYLTGKCNGKCSWCVEKDGYKPIYHAPVSTLVDRVLESGKRNVILLGGEPTLYPGIEQIINLLYTRDKNVYLTTNGSKLSPVFVNRKLYNLRGLNISVHHYQYEKNREITGVNLENLTAAIETAHKHNIRVRLNCNCIHGYIDSACEINNYIRYAIDIGADKVRFAELKNDAENFVDLAKIMNYTYGLNDDPYLCGCNKDAVILGMPVNFRQMCGFQTDLRPEPIDPERCAKNVLYYDGKFYDGWQKERKEDMTKKEVRKILDMVKTGKMSVEDAEELILSGKEKEVVVKTVHEYSGGGCAY